MRVLAVVAHPDDELLGVGGTLLRHVTDGDAVRVLIVCSQLDPDLRMDASRIEGVTTVAKEAGWSIEFGWQPTLALDIAKTTALVEQRLGSADLVYTHHLDINRDHRAIHEAVKVATRPFASAVRAVRCFSTPSSTEWGDPFNPSYFVAVDGRKYDLLRHYAAEMRPNPHPRSLDGVMSHDESWGRRVGLTAAEPFVTLWERR